MLAWPLHRRSASNPGVYFPHPAPGTPGYDEENDSHANMMSSTASVFKVRSSRVPYCISSANLRTHPQTVFIPATISLMLYLLVSYLLVPMWKRYRSRYSQYLPLDRISTQTSSVRERIHAALVRAAARWLLPSGWRTDFEAQQAAFTRGETSDFDEDEGEELYTVDDVESRRREALSLDVHRVTDDTGRRLSRELEEGFKDDSDESEDEAEVNGSRSQGILR